MDRFPEQLREHFAAPRHVGEPAGGVHRRGEARNAACGDHVVLYLQVGAPAPAPAVDGGAPAAPDPSSPVVRPAAPVVAAGFRARGCPVAMATASAACELLPGLPADEALPDALVERFEHRFGPPRPAHRHALALVVEALRAAAPPP